MPINNLTKKIWAVSDLHLEESTTRNAISSAPKFENSVLLLAGDVCTSVEIFEWAMNQFVQRFDLVVWSPGNHELRRSIRHSNEPSGPAKYETLVKICRENGVLTPEDPFSVCRTASGDRILVPLLLMYDYSFAPSGVSENSAVAWAADQGVTTPDVDLISPAPFDSIADWCKERCFLTLEKLSVLPPDKQAIFINHFPLHSSLLRLKPPPAFAIWCGTKTTESWLLGEWCNTVVYGHLHWPSIDRISGVEHIEVSLGHPHERNSKKECLEQFLYRIVQITIGCPSDRSPLSLPHDWPSSVI